jgi:hypothetical protein
MAVDGDDPRLGSLLGGRWRLQRLLGEGGMGVVYEARHERNGKRAAIKVLHALTDRDGVMFERFRREARIAALLEDSGGVVEVFDDDVADDGAPYIVMELLDGETFEQRAERAGGHLPLAEVVAMADAVLAVLAEAHERGVVHRDLKPANVFRTGDGRIKVLDFGIAGLRAQVEAGETKRPLTQPSSPMMGSIGFMPPEQARGEWDSLDARSDLWALGATMFALLGGRTVHAATSVRKELVRTMLDEAAPLSSVAPHVPDAVAAVVDRALLYQRDRRWPDATTMRSALADAAPAIDPLAATQEAPRVLAGSASPATDPGAAPAAAFAATGALPDPTTSRRARRSIPVLLGAAAVVSVVAWVLLRGSSPASVPGAAATHPPRDPGAPTSTAAGPSSAPRATGEPAPVLVAAPVTVTPLDELPDATPAPAASSPRSPASLLGPPAGPAVPPPVSSPSVAAGPAQVAAPPPPAPPAPDLDRRK